MLNPTTALGPGALPRATADAAPDGGGGAAFAQALGQAEARQRDARASDATGAQRKNGDDPGARGPSAGTGRAAGEAAGAPDDTGAPRATGAGDEDKDEDQGGTSADADPALTTPQGLAAWIAALPRPPAAARATAHAGTGGVDGADGAEDASRPRRPRGAPGLATPPERAGAGAPNAALAPPTDAALPAATASARAVPLEHGVGLIRAASDADADADAAGASAGLPTPLAALTALTALTAAAGPAQAQTSPGAAAAAPLHAELQAAVGSPAFAPALASQLSVLVRDGIEHAQLKLNPAELGPIEVRIALDGNRAQVDFSAAHAATRQALQDAVPALASALRESGLTLAGGGVFEQPREQRGDAPPRGTHAPSAAGPDSGDDTPFAATAPRPLRARGVLDLYA